MNIATVPRDKDVNRKDKKPVSGWRSKEKHHKDLCKLIHETWIKKNNDYGDSFGKSFHKRGIAAAMVRMEDKWNRLDALTRAKGEVKVKDETLIDTLLDLSNYCLMTVMELQREEYSRKRVDEQPAEDVEASENK